LPSNTADIDVAGLSAAVDIAITEEQVISVGGAALGRRPVAVGKDSGKPRIGR